ncbi:hypothetical protein QFZ89_007876 [Paraburkholderia youngii]
MDSARLALSQLLEAANARQCHTALNVLEMRTRWADLSEPAQRLHQESSTKSYSFPGVHEGKKKGLAERHM